MKIWNVAVVGCGSISKIFIENMINKMDNLNVVACCSKNGKSAIRKAKDYGLKAMTFEEIMADPEIEVIVNLTPPIEHYDIIKAALENGKHVYTEKTMTSTYEEAKELVALAKSRNLMLGSAPDTCLGAAIQTAKKAVETGLIGEITGCVVSLNRNLGVMYENLRFLIQPGAGIGFDMGIYYLSALLTILGPVTEVSGRIATHNPIRTIQNKDSDDYGQQYEIKNENIMVGNMELKNGVLGTVMFNGICIFPEKPYIAIQGTEGILYLPDPNAFGGKVLLQRQFTDMEEELELVNPYVENCRGLGVSELLKGFENNENIIVSIEMAAHAIEILEGIVESSSTKRFIAINSTF